MLDTILFAHPALDTMMDAPETPDPPVDWRKRPRIPGPQRKVCRLSLRATQDEWHQIHQLAADAGMTLRDWIVSRSLTRD